MVSKMLFKIAIVNPFFHNLAYFYLDNKAISSRKKQIDFIRKSPGSKEPDDYLQKLLLLRRFFEVD